MKVITSQDQSVDINNNPNWLYIPDHPHRILIIGGSGSGKTYVLLNLTKHQRPDIDKDYVYVNDPFESKYQQLINGREKVETEHLKNPKAFTDYLQTIGDVYENLEGYNPAKKRRMLIVSHDMIADMESNKKISVNWVLRGRKLYISLVISQSFFKVPETIRLNAKLLL